MADDIRTVLKDFNRDLITEELVASALPFESIFLAGFQRKGNSRFVGEPTADPKLISRDGVSGVEDFADPGEIRFVFTIALTVPQGAALDALLLAHDATVHTADQDRTRQDTQDYATLELQFPNIDAMTNDQFKDYVTVMARLIIRENRNAPI